MRDAIVAFAPQVVFEVPESVGQKTLKYPFDTMGVNGFIFVEIDKAQAARQAACNYGKRHGMVFQSKRYGSFVKIWRAA